MLNNTIVVKTFNDHNYLFYYIKYGSENYIRYENDTKLIKRIVLKPNLLIYYVDGSYKTGVELFNIDNYNDNSGLVSDCIIDSDIFYDLIEHGLISYSKLVADLYNLPVTYSYDVKHHHNDYKRTDCLQRQKILSRLKSGNFN